MRTSRRAIEQFLSLHRIAVVGVSRQEVSYSRYIWKELRGRGYDLVPVNLNADLIDGILAAKTISDVDPPPEGVMLMVPPPQSLALVREAVEQGVRSIWFGRDTVSREAVDLAQESGCEVVVGECPLMFLEKTGFPHSWHRALRIVTMTMPR